MIANRVPLIVHDKLTASERDEGVPVVDKSEDAAPEGQ